jgi:hypothetical protein
MASRPGHSYSNIYHSDSSRSHLGDVYNQYGPSPDQQAFRVVLDSLRYDGMDDRMNRLSSAERGTFEWALAERAVESMVDRDDASEESGQEDDQDDEHYNEGGERDGASDSEEENIDDDANDESGSEDDLWHSTKTIDGAFTHWLATDKEEGGLFCFMGKPGSGKSTLMYALYKDKAAGYRVLH